MPDSPKPRSPAEELLARVEFPVVDRVTWLLTAPIPLPWLVALCTVWVIIVGFFIVTIATS